MGEMIIQSNNLEIIEPADFKVAIEQAKQESYRYYPEEQQFPFPLQNNFEYERILCHSTLIGGNTGTGKSTLMYSLLTTCINKGYGVLLIDPHGKLYKQVVSYCMLHEEYKKKLICLDATQDEFITGYNPIRSIPESTEKTAFELMRTVFMVNNENPADHPRTQSVLLECFRILLVTNSPLPYILDLIDYRDNPIRDHLLDKVLKKHKELVPRLEMFVQQSKKRKDFFQLAATEFEALNNRLQPLQYSFLRKIFSQKKSINPFTIMRDGKILLCNISSETNLGTNGGRMLGAMLVNDFYATSGEKGRIDDIENPFYIFVDECSSYITQSMIESVYQRRKKQLFFILGLQFKDQLDGKGTEGQSTDGLIKALMNFPNHVVFNCGTQDTPFYLDKIFSANYKGAMKKEEQLGVTWKPVQSYKQVPVIEETLQKISVSSKEEKEDTNTIDQNNESTTAINKNILNKRSGNLTQNSEKTSDLKGSTHTHEQNFMKKDTTTVQTRQGDMNTTIESNLFMKAVMSQEQDNHSIQKSQEQRQQKTDISSFAHSTASEFSLSDMLNKSTLSESQQAKDTIQKQQQSSKLGMSLSNIISDEKYSDTGTTKVSGTETYTKDSSGNKSEDGFKDSKGEIRSRSDSTNDIFNYSTDSEKRMAETSDQRNDVSNSGSYSTSGDYRQYEGGATEKDLVNEESKNGYREKSGSNSLQDYQQHIESSSQNSELNRFTMSSGTQKSEASIMKESEQRQKQNRHEDTAMNSEMNLQKQDSLKIHGKTDTEQSLTSASRQAVEEKIKALVNSDENQTIKGLKEIEQLTKDSSILKQYFDELGKTKQREKAIAHVTSYIRSTSLHNVSSQKEQKIQTRKVVTKMELVTEMEEMTLHQGTTYWTKKEYDTYCTGLLLGLPLYSFFYRHSYEKEPYFIKTKNTLSPYDNIMKKAEVQGIEAQRKAYMQFENMLMNFYDELSETESNKFFVHSTKSVDLDKIRAEQKQLLFEQREESKYMEPKKTENKTSPVDQNDVSGIFDP